MIELLLALVGLFTCWIAIYKLAQLVRILRDFVNLLGDIKDVNILLRKPEIIDYFIELNKAGEKIEGMISNIDNYLKDDSKPDQSDS